MGVYYNGSTVSAVVMATAVAGWDYGVQRDPANGFGLVKRLTGSTGDWAAIGSNSYNFGAPNYPGALITQASLFGSA
jgi:hypothetical protein